MTFTEIEDNLAAIDMAAKNDWEDTSREERYWMRAYQDLANAYIEGEIK